MSLFKEYVPWRHVCIFLGIPSVLARHYVKKYKVRTKSNPYNKIHLLYDMEDVRLLKETLKQPLTFVRGENGQFVRWERKEV